MSIDKKFIEQFISVTSKAALAASFLVGKNDKIAADQAAVDSMRTELNNLDMTGEVVIGEGALDEAPLLYTGEVLGKKNGPYFDIAVDPVEGTNFVANNLPGGIAVLAISEKGNLFNAPETYMDKIATGKIDNGVIDLDNSLEQNIKNLSDEDYDNIEKITQKLCEERDFELLAHQKFVRNFLSYKTPYNSLLLYHGLGTGKTCSAIGVAEEMRDYMKKMNIKKKILIIASPNVQENFRLQLFDERKLKKQKLKR